MRSLLCEAGVEAGVEVGPEGKLGRRGFTLIEVLIAMALMAALLAALYTTFFTVFAGRETVNFELERTREVRRFIELVTMEVESAFYDAKNPVTLFKGDKEKSGPWGLEFTYFTHTVIRKDLPVSDLKRAIYSVERKDEGLTLYKELFDAYAPGKVGDFKVAVLEGLSLVSFEYYDGESWVKEWRALGEITTPEAVKIKIAFSDAGGDDDGAGDYTAVARPRIR